MLLFIGLWSCLPLHNVSRPIAHIVVALSLLEPNETRARHKLSEQNVPAFNILVRNRNPKLFQTYHKSRAVLEL